MKERSMQALYRRAGELNLPSEVLGDTRIEIIGDHQAVLTGHRGIRSYLPEEIIVELPGGALSLRGRDLGISVMSGRELLIRGALDSLSFLR